MSPFRLLLNFLVPGRRRRRFHFLQICQQLQRLELPSDVWHESFNLTAGEFANVVAGFQQPPAWVKSVACGAYKLPAARAIDVYGPIVSFVIMVPFALLLYFLLR